MLRYILLSLALYLGYKLVFDIIVPVFRTTQKIRQQFGAMQDHMQNQMNQNGPAFTENSQQQGPIPEKKKASAGDYIDFEEVK